MTKPKILLIALILLATATATSAFKYDVNHICTEGCLQNTSVLFNVTLYNEGVDPIDLLRITVLKTGTNLLLGLLNTSNTFVSTKKNFAIEGVLPSYYGEPEINYSLCFATQIKPSNRIVSGVYIGISTLYCEKRNHTIPVYQCILNDSCFENQICVQNECVSLNCTSCQTVENHKCVDYQCCTDSQCGDTQKCLENRCEFLKCAGDEYATNNTCVKLDCDTAEEAVNGSCQKLNCNGTEHPANHKCIPLVCRDSEYAAFNRCSPVICGENQTAKNHSCINTEIPKPKTPIFSASRVAETAILLIIAWLCLKLLYKYHDKHKRSTQNI